MPEVAEQERDQSGKPRLDRRDLVEVDQIVERLGWSPAERLQYLVDVLAFEQRARRARRLA
jgi:hypothetical protein